jgi:hypothetical protein
LAAKRGRGLTVRGAWETGLVSGVWVLGGRGDGDVEAEGLEAAEVGAGLAVAVGFALVPVGAEVGVSGPGVAEQVPDDECDTRSHMLRVNLADWRASMT